MLTHQKSKLRVLIQKATFAIFCIAASNFLMAQTGTSSDPVFMYKVKENIESWHRLPPSFDGSGISQIEMLNLTEYTATREQITTVDNEDNVTATTNLLENSDPARSPELSKIVSDINGVRTYEFNGKETTNVPHSDMGLEAFLEMTSYYKQLISNPTNFSQSVLLSAEDLQNLDQSATVITGPGSSFALQTSFGITLQIDPEMGQETITFTDDDGIPTKREVIVYCKEEGLKGLPCFREEVSYEKLTDGTCIEHVTRTIYSEHDIQIRSLDAQQRESKMTPSPIVTFNNPAVNDLHLTLLHFTSSVDVQLWTIQGQLAKQWTMAGHLPRGTSYNLNGLQAGLYILTVNDGEDALSYKITIQ